MRIWKRGGLLGAGVLLLAACSGAGGGGPPPEKVAMQSSPLIQVNPNPPYTFPSTAAIGSCRDTPTQLLPQSAAGSAAWAYGENYVAFAVTDTLNDPYATQYSHGYTYNETSGLNGQLESDFFGIPNGNGYKYEVALLTEQINPGTGAPELVQSGRNWFIEGVARVDTGWLMYPPGGQPWCLNRHGGPCPTGVAYFDPNSHPPYGTDQKSADWLDLWDLAWTYSWVPQDGSPDGPYADPGRSPNTFQIESEHHQCAFVYACPGGTQSCTASAQCPSGQTCELNASGTSTCWAPCFNPATGTFDYDQGQSLVPIDFFVAMERHDPMCASHCW